MAVALPLICPVLSGWELRTVQWLLLGATPPWDIENENLENTALEFVLAGCLLKAVCMVDAVHVLHAGWWHVFLWFSLEYDFVELKDGRLDEYMQNVGEHGAEDEDTQRGVQLQGRKKSFVGHGGPFLLSL